MMRCQQHKVKLCAIKHVTLVVLPKYINQLSLQYSQTPIFPMNTRKNNTTTRARTAQKGLHPRNTHQHGYDFASLIQSHPALQAHVKTNPFNNTSVDFANPETVKCLNTALLAHHYNIKDWDIPKGYLCPPIPGRVDYIHYMADLLASSVPPSDTNAPMKLLDIGTGANGIYSLLAHQVYGWSCVASDIDPHALDNLSSVIRRNPKIKNHLKLRLQPEKHHIFDGIIQPGERFDVSVCNPPFHASQEEAQKGSHRKLKNLASNRGETFHTTSSVSPSLNFGGQNAELWCKGGERKFLRLMIKESREFADQCRWFTSLVSKSDNVKPAKKLLRKMEATDIKEIEMWHGSKITRVLAWTYQPS